MKQIQFIYACIVAYSFPILCLLYCCSCSTYRKELNKYIGEPVEKVYCKYGANPDSVWATKKGLQAIRYDKKAFGTFHDTVNQYRIFLVAKDGHVIDWYFQQRGKDITDCKSIWR